MKIHPAIYITGYLGAPQFTPGYRSRSWPALFLEVEVTGKFVPVTLFTANFYATTLAKKLPFLAYQAVTDVKIVYTENNVPWETLIPAGDIFHGHIGVELSDAILSAC